MNSKITKGVYGQAALISCSICHAEGVTKTTCPLNPYAINPNPDKHNTGRPEKSLDKKTRLPSPRSRETASIPIMDYNMSIEYKNIDITAGMRLYISENNLTDITNIDLFTEDGLVTEIRNLTNHTLSSIMDNTNKYMAATSWNWNKPANWEQSYSFDLTGSVIIYLPYCRAVQSDIIGDWIKLQILGLKCHEDMHRDIVLNIFKKHKTNIAAFTTSGLKKIKYITNILSKLPDELLAASDSLDDINTHGCDLDKDIYYKSCKIKCGIDIDDDLRRRKELKERKDNLTNVLIMHDTKFGEGAERNWKWIAATMKKQS